MCVRELTLIMAKLHEISDMRVAVVVVVVGRAQEPLA